VKPGAGAAAGALALVGLGGLLAAGCSGDRSYAVVTVRSSGSEFVNVAQFQVQVLNDPGRRDTLYYPLSPGGPFRVSTTDTVDFSVSFSPSFLGTLEVGVAPRDLSGASLGYGEAEQAIDPGDTIRLEVLVTRDALPPPAPDEAGPGSLPAALIPRYADE
jgi:hypothetical protein